MLFDIYNQQTLKLLEEYQRVYRVSFYVYKYSFWPIFFGWPTLLKYRIWCADIFGFLEVLCSLAIVVQCDIRSKTRVIFRKKKKKKLRRSNVCLHFDSNTGTAMYPSRWNAALTNAAGVQDFVKVNAKTPIHYFSVENTPFLTKIYGMTTCFHILSWCEKLETLSNNKYDTNTALVCL